MEKTIVTLAMLWLVVSVNLHGIVAQEEEFGANYTTRIRSDHLDHSGALSVNDHALAHKRSEFLKHLFEDYDESLAPNFDDDQPTEVELEIFINSFDSISELTMDYSVDIYLRRTWNDPRLVFDGRIINVTLLTLDTKLIDKVWVPDLFFSNEKKASFHEVTVPNRLLRIYQNGTVFFSSRITLTVTCPMKLEKFPLDSQVCELKLESFAYTTNIIKFKWSGEKPLEVKEGLVLPQFKLTKTEFKDCTQHYKTGNFTCLMVEFYLTRDIVYYIIQTYVPSVLIVILSWVSFWISSESVPARISLGLLTVLTMTTQTSSIRSSLPPVSYIKAIDVWMAVCLAFVFLALLEFAFVNVQTRVQVRRQTIRIPAAGDQIKKEKQSAQEVLVPPNSPGLRELSGLRKARMIDKFSRIIFPTSFCLFNLVYWIFYGTWEGFS